MKLAGCCRPWRLKGRARLCKASFQFVLGQDVLLMQPRELCDLVLERVAHVQFAIESKELVLSPSVDFINDPIMFAVLDHEDVARLRALWVKIVVASIESEPRGR